MKKPFPEPGTWCTFEHKGQIAGTGYFNSHSLIAGRVMSWESETDLKKLIRRRLFGAFSRRQNDIARGSARLVFSEADFLPGLIIDWYSGVAVLQSNTAGIDTIMPILEELVPSIFGEVFKQQLTGFIVRGDSSIRELEGIQPFSRVILGDPAKLAEVQFTEDGLTYCADLVHGQKTGFFLDQRDNRRAFGVYAKQQHLRNVLDLFSYSGGWGIRALMSGAQHATFVDQSADALALVKRSMELNKIPVDRATFVQKDVFDFLEQDKNEYDVVVADPPAFVKSKKNLPQAMRAYEKLNRVAFAHVKNGGALFTCSCSYHLTEPDFLGMLKAALRHENEGALMFYRGAQGQDHPVLLSMPETNYLKCAGIKKVGFREKL